jgi:hypothetical protein
VNGIPFESSPELLSIVEILLIFQDQKEFMCLCESGDMGLVVPPGYSSTKWMLEIRLSWSHRLLYFAACPY